MRFLLFILFCFTLNAQEVFLSLSATIETALENPERTNKLLASVNRPSDSLIAQLETDILAELRSRNAESAYRERKQQELIAKIRYLYFFANKESEYRKLLLRLNGLPDDLTVHADDSVYDILQPMLWNGEKRLAAIARRNRTDLRLPGNNAIRYAFQIQFDLANFNFDSSNKISALIELAKLCAWHPEKERLPSALSPVPGNNEFILIQEKPSPLFNVYVNTFRLVDWSAY